MRALAETARYFAPELDVVSFPAWDCLPYDRASPSLRVTSERLAALHALQRREAAAQLVVTTVNAVTQRTLTPFRLRQLAAQGQPAAQLSDELRSELRLLSRTIAAAMDGQRVRAAPAPMTAERDPRR